jgi:hypothetical protein
MILTLSLALADKLTDGWRGKPYGDAAVLTEAPGDKCVRRPEAEVEWRCDEKVGDAPVVVTYFVFEGLYVGVGITASGYMDCVILRDALGAAWPNFTPKYEKKSAYAMTDDGFWNLGGEVSGVWDWNEYKLGGRGECAATVAHGAYYRAARDAKKRRSEKAAEAL